ncbi:MAG: hypothetical protein KC613_03060 [Myxococcales bacterium]|nr:hypothetical protein [Myxococcales bacterium]
MPAHARLVWSALIPLLALGGCEDDNGPQGPLSPRDAGNIYMDTGTGDVGALPMRDARVDFAPTPDDAAVDAQAADAGPEDMTTPDLGAEDAAPPVDMGPVEPCPEAVPVRLGVQVTDLNGDPLEPGDPLQVQVTVRPQGPVGVPTWLVLSHGNVTVEPGVVVTRDGDPVGVQQDANTVIIPLPQAEQATFVYGATVTGREALMAVMASLNLTERGCPNPNSRAAALLQLIGGNGKTPVCFDLAEYASLQIAPAVPLQNTGAYRDANGLRQDLLADEFIYCPGAPTVVHTAEFCAVHHPDLRVSLAGDPHGGGTWEVDDFALFEVFRDDALLADGVTTQTHPGGNTFWCGDIQQLMCTEGCTATLSRGGQPIRPLATVPATGGQARQHQDGAVALDPLFPADGDPFNLRVTALDVGVEGTINPGLYLVVEQD